MKSMIDKIVEMKFKILKAFTSALMFICILMLVALAFSS